MQVDITINLHFLTSPSLSNVFFFFLLRHVYMSLTYINKQIFNKLPVEMDDFHLALFCHAFRLTHLW